MYSVYCHKNNVNGKVYIGITSQDPKERWKNGNGYRENKKFYSDIEKFGWDKFQHKIIVDGLSGKQAAKIEKELISAYNSINDGYNRSIGVGTASPHLLGNKAGNVYRAIKKFPDFFEDEKKMFEAAIDSGKGSNLLENINLYSEYIVNKLTEEHDAPGYNDFMWLCHFFYELKRETMRCDYWTKHETVNGFVYPTWQEHMESMLLII